MPTSNQNPHLNLFQHLLGTSRIAVTLNILLVSFAILLVTLCLLAPLIKLVLDVLDFKNLKDRHLVFLELTPPTYSTKSQRATTELLSVVQSVGSIRSFKAKLLRRKNVITCEIVSTRQGGIRYLICLQKNKIASCQQLIASYLPDLRFKLVDDYLPPSKIIPSGFTRLYEFKQTRHFAFPLASKNSLNQYDPIAYITGTMTKLEANELIAFQLVLSPAPRQKATKAWNKLLNGSKQQTPQSQRIIDDIHGKLKQPLFRTDIRVLIRVNSVDHAHERSEGLVGSISSFSVPGYQGFVRRNNFPAKWRIRSRLLKFSKRLPSALTFSTNIFAASEVADLYHFPYVPTTQTENIIKSLSRTLPAPITLKDGTELDVLLGENHHNNQITAIGLTEAERERHVYIVGGTGNGKTTMLIYSIVQDIKNGKGIAIIDPHGDLAESVLRHIPEERINDVIYINPVDVSHPIGLNLLELQPSASGDELLIEKDMVTEAVISIFHKIFSDDDSGGHRVEYILRNAIQTALSIEGSTLFTIFDLLNDPNFRHGVVKNLKDRNLKNFWINEFSKAGSYQKVKMSAGITAKVGRFLFSTSARRTFEQPKSTIDFDDILSSGKILICNFSKGLLGEDASVLFGTTVLAKIQLATLRRAKVPPNKRQPFYFYIDEFQNFATTSFLQLLSEARKYKLFLTMAEQSTSQQAEDHMVDTILANVGTIVCFRSASPADERFLLPLFKPYIEAGEISNLPSYNFYIRINAVNANEPLSGMTALLENNGSEAIAMRIKEYSRMHNAILYKDKRKEESISDTVQEPGVGPITKNIPVIPIHGSARG